MENSLPSFSGTARTGLRSSGGPGRHRRQRRPVDTAGDLRRAPDASAAIPESSAPDSSVGIRDRETASCTTDARRSGPSRHQQQGQRELRRCGCGWTCWRTSPYWLRPVITRPWRRPGDQMSRLHTRQLMTQHRAQPAVKQIEDPVTHTPPRCAGCVRVAKALGLAGVEMSCGIGWCAAGRVPDDPVHLDLGDRLRLHRSRQLVAVEEKLRDGQHWRCRGRSAGVGGTDRRRTRSTRTSPPGGRTS